MFNIGGAEQLGRADFAAAIVGSLNKIGGLAKLDGSLVKSTATENAGQASDPHPAPHLPTHTRASPFSLRRPFITHFVAKGVHSGRSDVAPCSSHPTLFILLSSSCSPHPTRCILLSSFYFLHPTVFILLHSQAARRPLVSGLCLKKLTSTIPDWKPRLVAHGLLCTL